MSAEGDRRVSLASVDELENAKCNVSLTRNSCASTAGLSQPSLSLPTRTAAPPQVLASNSISVALHIVPDQNWLSMWRIALPDGRSSGMLNLTRAKDVLRRAKRFQPTFLTLVYCRREGDAPSRRWHRPAPGHVTLGPRAGSDCFLQLHPLGLGHRLRHLAGSLESSGARNFSFLEDDLVTSTHATAAVKGGLGRFAASVGDLHRCFPSLRRARPAGGIGTAARLTGLGCRTARG